MEINALEFRKCLKTSIGLVLAVLLSISIEFLNFH